jgi:hypothetical protein
VRPSIRFEVFKRDRFTCSYCGSHPPDVQLEVDHVTPRSAGGLDELDNLITACLECNRGKGARLLEEGAGPSFAAATEATVREMSDVTERLHQARAYRRQLEELEDRRADLRDELWAYWAHHLDGSTAESGWTCPFGFPDDRSLAYFMRTMSPDRILEAISSTGNKFRRGHNGYVRKDEQDHCKRYFYAVCHAMLREQSL